MEFFGSLVYILGKKEATKWKKKIAKLSKSQFFKNEILAEMLLASKNILSGSTLGVYHTL
jgi:hypothetical protein